MMSLELSEIIDKIQVGFQETSWAERLASLFGIVQVLLSRKNKVSNYFFGILSIVLTIAVLYGARLYAELVLNLYYLVMSFYGLWYWKFRNSSLEQPQVLITRCTAKEWKIVGLIVIGGFLLLYLALSTFTNSDVPVVDAIVSSTAWAGMWLLAKRKLENWILLNISNFIAVPLLVHKELYLFACLTLFLFIVAIFGYVEWKKLMATQAVQHAKR